MTANIEIAVIDDDFSSLSYMEHELKSNKLEKINEDLNWHWYHTGGNFQYNVSSIKFDVVLLSSALSDMAGEEILVWLRRHMPVEMVIFIVSSETNPTQIINLLKLGADDYITKPFNFSVLVEKIRICVKRTNKKLDLSKFAISGFNFDRGAQTVIFQNCTFECTLLELELLHYLLIHLDKPLTRKQIFEAVWRRRGVDTSRAVDNQMHRLRAKFNLTPTNGFILQPIYGIGYRLSTVEQGFTERVHRDC